MTDLDNYSTPRNDGFFNNINPCLRAAAIFALPFIIADFFNYYSAGTTLIFSLPVLSLLYAGCGALACKFAGANHSPAELLYLGAFAGLILWLVSTTVNTIIALIIGTMSFGTTFMLGLPFLCICAPIQLIGGGIMGALGGFFFSLFQKGTPS